MIPRLIMVAAVAGMSGCAHNPYSPAWKVSARYDAYENYRPTPIEIAQLRATYYELKPQWEERNRGKPFPIEKINRDPYQKVKVTDVDVVLYADHVRNILSTKFTNARFARYTGATVQVVLAGAAGAAAAFSGGMTMIASLAFGSAVTPEVSKIFGSSERAVLYQAQAIKIDLGLEQYASKNGEDPGEASDTKLTPHGRQLYVDVITAINGVDAGLAGLVPEAVSKEEAKALRARIDDLYANILSEQKASREELVKYHAELEKLKKKDSEEVPSTTPPSG